MGITEAEQIQHEYYYRSRRVLHSQKPQWLSDSAINVNGTTIPLSWGQPLNWLGGVPNAAGAEANFWRTLTANRTITLDGSKTVGTMTFDSPFSYTISPGTGGSIVFNNRPGRDAHVDSRQSHNQHWRAAHQQFERNDQRGYVHHQWSCLRRRRPHQDRRRHSVTHGCKLLCRQYSRAGWNVENR